MAPLPLFSSVPLRQRYANMPRLSRAPDGGPGSSVRARAACAGGTAAGARLLPGRLIVRASSGRSAR